MTTGSSTPASKREATCTAILDAASAVIAERGVDGFTISHVAERADVNRALIYHYFKDRETLIADTIDHVLAGYEGSGAAEMTSDALEVGLRQLMAHPEFCRFFIQLMLNGRPLRAPGARFMRTIDAMNEFQRTHAPDSEVDTVFGLIAILLTTMTWTFSRDEIAGHLQIPAEEGDERMLAIFRRWTEYARRKITSDS